MDANHERYFFISGLISISLFVGLVISAGFSLFLSPKVEQFAMIQSDVINISITTDESSTSDESVPEAQSETVREPLVEETPKNVEPVPEISDLFSQVSSEKAAQKRPDDTKRNEQLNALEKEILQKKETSRFSDKVSKVELLKPSVEVSMQGGSTGPNVDKYLAKVQGLVKTYFHPQSGSVGESAVVVLRIDAKGKMINFKILRSSRNSAFNEEVNWLKDRLNGIRFPESPDGNEGVVTCTLMAKD